jgi:hypothetical protein
MAYLSVVVSGSSGVECREKALLSVSGGTQQRVHDVSFGARDDRGASRSGTVDR